MSRTLRLYRELAEIPLYTAAHYIKSGSANSTIRVTTSVRDHLRNIKRIRNKHIISTSSGVTVVPSQDALDSVASIPSPSGQRLAVLREIPEGNSKKRFVEVWYGDRLEAIKDVTKTHGDFHVNPLLFSLSFCKAESSFVYTAEAAVPDTNNLSSEEKVKKLRFSPDFGESLVGKKRPALYLFRWTPQKYEDKQNESSIEGISDESAIVVELNPSLPEDSSIVFGQAVFAPDNETIFATGYEKTLDGRRLGVTGCWNRGHIGIWSLKLPTENLNNSESVACIAHRLTPPDISAHSPRVSDDSPDQKFTLIWLANKVGGPHASATALHAMRSDEEKPRVLVNFISEPSSVDGFPGLYVDQLPSRPFLCLGPDPNAASHLVTHSIWRSRQTILQISLESGEVHDLTPEGHFAWTVANTDGHNRILATRSGPSSPNELREALLGGGPPNWKVLDKPLLSLFARKCLNTLETSVVPIPDRFPTETIIIRQAGGKTTPLVSMPHGGPHSSFISDFNAPLAALALEGYTLSLINYTGSLGFGQKYVDALIGRAGELDIEDCFASAKHLVSIGLAQEGPGKQFAQGGSHGGFISAHLIGQYPDFFSAVVLRNPVIAAGEIASVSDIPDWAFNQFGETFNPTSVISPEIFAKLHDASPIARIDAIKAPVLLLVGDVDRRVPPSQSQTFYYALKGRGKVVDMLVFPDNGHRLDGVEAGLVGWEAGRDWFAKYL